MSNFDAIKNSEGKEYLIFDSSELYDDTQLGDKSDDFEILRKLGEGAFGKVFKVRSKKNNKVYAMKKANIKELKEENEKAYQLTLNETSFLKELNHSHIIKYYKNFIEGDYLYIIIEFVANGDIEGYMKAHQIYNKHIEEEKLWNIFLQCMEALTYVHSMGVIHRDIKPVNLLMDNNMTVKLGDFGVSAVRMKEENTLYLNGIYNPFKNKDNLKYHQTLVGTNGYMAKEIIENNEYDQKVDVFSMGVSFYEMCYFHFPKWMYLNYDDNGKIHFKFEKIAEEKDKNVHYSKELLDIIELMLEEDKNKRKTSKEIYDMIKEQYSKKFVRDTSIDAIMRCLSSYNNLNKWFFNSGFVNVNKCPISSAYIQCLNCCSNQKLQDWSRCIKNLRQKMGTENPKFQDSKEIEPRLLFAFLIEKLHKELNKPQKVVDINKDHLIISGEEYKTSKVEMMLKFLDDFSSQNNSVISNNFLGLMKNTNFCNNCKLRTYLFTSYFFVTIKLEKLLKASNSSLNIDQLMLVLNQSIKSENMFCSKCFNYTRHTCYKNFYSVPNFLIISLQRGITYNIKTPVNIQENLDLTKIVEFLYCQKSFKLIGFLGRNNVNGNAAFFSVVKNGNSWFYYQGFSVYEVQLSQYQNHSSQGDILMLFYESF